MTWIEVTPETLPKPYTLCVLLVAEGRGMFAIGGLNDEGEWYFSDYKGVPEPLFYLPFPIMTKEMHEKWEIVFEEKSEHVKNNED